MNVDGVKAQVVHCSLVTLFQLWDLNLFLKLCISDLKSQFLSIQQEVVKNLNFVIYIAIQKLLKPWACLK